MGDIDVKEDIKKYIMTKIVLSFDDGRWDEYDAIKLASSYGIKSTLNVTTAYVENSVYTDAGDCPAMTREQVIELYKDPNVEIAGHSHTHVNDFIDIVKGQRLLEQWLDTNEPLGFASPHSQLDLDLYPLQKFKEEKFLYVRKSQVYDSLSGIYRYVRKTSRILGLKWPLYWTYKNTFSNTIEDDYLVHGFGVLRDHSFKQIKYLINKAVKNNYDVVLIMHSICKPDHNLAKNLYSWDWAKFDELCRFIQSMENKVCWSQLQPKN